MSSCKPRRMASICGPADYSGYASLRKMVDHFIRERGYLMDTERDWWGNPDLPFAEACRRALFRLQNDQVRDGHQWTFSVDALDGFAKTLAHNRSSLESASTFQELYQGVERALRLAPNRKPLLIYDISRRLGFRLGRQPETVYLHAGTRAGANALKPGLGRPRTRPMAEFPTSIRTRLTPAQAEDFLCVASKWLRADLWD